MAGQSPTPIKHFTEKEAAAIYGYSVAWFQRKRWEGSGPPYRKIGRAVRYPSDELVTWFESHVLQTRTSDIQMVPEPLEL